MKRFLRLSNLSFLCLLLLVGCTPSYTKYLRPANNIGSSAQRYKPVFDKILYRCTVDGRFIFDKYHLSGLLFFKKLENGTERAIYQNEMGLTFFDFEWSSKDSFKINKLIPQLNKPGLVKVLRKDMQLFLMKGLSEEKVFERDRGNEVLYCYTIDGGYAYYIEQNKQLVRIDNTGKKKIVTTINLKGKTTPEAMPQSVLFNHHKANFTIKLEKIDSDVNE